MWAGRQASLLIVHSVAGRYERAAASKVRLRELLTEVIGRCHSARDCRLIDADNSAQLLYAAELTGRTTMNVRYIFDCAMFLEEIACRVRFGSLRNIFHAR